MIISSIELREIRLPLVHFFETSFGRTTTLAGFILPGDVSASKRYWATDIIEPAVTVSPRGTIQVPDGPSLAFKVNLVRIESLTVRRATIKSNSSAAA